MARFDFYVFVKLIGGLKAPRSLRILLGFRGRDANTREGE